MTIKLRTLFPLLFVSILSVVIVECSSDPLSEYNLQKKYWDVTDYDKALNLIQYHTANTEKFPCYATPSKTPIFLKLVDPTNFEIVMQDTSLGLEHRKEFSEKMFEDYKGMFQIYSIMDNQDKFVYPKEFAQVIAFGMELQIGYFKLGNESIKKESDNPNSGQVQDIIHSNERSLINNFDIDLGYVKKEKAFSDDALAIYTASIDKFSKVLINEFPNADYSDMLSKAMLMKDKAESNVVKTALTNLIELIQANDKSKAIPPTN